MIALAAIDRDFELFTMVRSILEGLQRRSKIPLEILCTSALATVLSFLALTNQTTLPFKLCGHVYAKPSVEFWLLTSIVSLIIFANSAAKVLSRCFAICSRADQENRTAHLVPCVGIDIHNNSRALFLRQWSILLCVGIYAYIPGAMISVYRSQLAPIYPALGFILALQLLNMFLAITMNLVPKGRRSKINKFIDCLSVLGTDKEYDAPDFENGLCRFDEFGDAPSGRTTELAQYAQVVFDLGNGNSLWMRSNENVGLRCTVSTLGFLLSWLGKLPKGRLVRIENCNLNFELVKVRVPYSIMWYSVYKELERIEGYRGAEDIDKCLIWLALVSLLTAFLISCIPGPCVVIKTKNREASRSEK